MPRIPEFNRQCMGRHLRLGRQTRGYSVERVARAFKYPGSVIDAWEAGRLLPGTGELQTMCRWYGLDAYAVFWPPRIKIVSSNLIGGRDPATRSLH